MHKQIFVNLPVADVARTMTFFRSLGLDFEPKFTDARAACLILGENIYAMLLETSMFAGFSSKPVADATKTCEVLIALTCESRAQVDDLVARAVAAGGTAPRPSVDHGFMYAHGFDDLDGHGWEVFHMVDHPGPAPA
jgi:predicted lactoylglutathione lyase